MSWYFSIVRSKSAKDGKNTKKQAKLRQDGERVEIRDCIFRLQRYMKGPRANYMAQIVNCKYRLHTYTYIKIQIQLYIYIYCIELRNLYFINFSDKPASLRSFTTSATF